MTFIPYSKVNHLYSANMLNALYYHADAEIQYMIIHRVKILDLITRDVYDKTINKLERYRNKCWLLLDEGKKLKYGNLLRTDDDDEE